MKENLVKRKITGKNHARVWGEKILMTKAKSKYLIYKAFFNLKYIYNSVSIYIKRFYAVIYIVYVKFIKYVANKVNNNLEKNTWCRFFFGELS